MCYFCDGATADYEAYLSAIESLRAKAIDDSTFLQCAAKADRLRFELSPEWSEAPIASSVKEHIFLNPDPDQGLLLFILAAWLDLQAPYTRVWNQMLAEARHWIGERAWGGSDAGLPRGSFGPTRPHLLKTVAAISQADNRRSLASWMAAAILGIVQRHSARRGNVFRLVGEICRDLYQASDQTFVRLMAGGQLPTDYGGTHYKRLWMLMMFLRKDTHVVRCLLRRALSSVEHGAEALEYWEDDLFFDPSECELPVDTRVKAAWEALPFVGAKDLAIEAIARDARVLARRASVAPASFDALLFFR
jgi:hypothetical protein